MSPNELVDLLCRLTVHMDEELRGLSFQSLQTLIVDFPEWRQDVLAGFTQFLAKEVQVRHFSSLSVYFSLLILNELTTHFVLNDYWSP